MEQVITNIDGSNYNNIRGMLKSQDRENTVVALSILEQAEMRKCLPYILCLLKDEVAVTEEEWKENAPKLLAKLQSLNVKAQGISSSSSEALTYKKMYEICKDQCDKEGIQFMINKFAATLQGLLADWGIDMIKELDLNLTIKQDADQS